MTLWRLLVEPKSNVRTLERLRIFNMRNNMTAEEAAMQPDFNVQSVFLGYNRILVGMRSGTVQEVAISEDPKKYKVADGAALNIKTWMKSTDHEQPKSVGIDMVSQRIFTITSKGLFSVWELNTLEIIFQKAFARTTSNLQTFQLSMKVMIVFERDIIVLDTSEHSNFDEVPGFSLTLTCERRH